MPTFQRHVFVCINERPADHPKGCCKARGGSEVRDQLKAELKARGIGKVVRANNAGCLDQCEHGVCVVVYPEQVWYSRVTVADVTEIVDKHLVGGVAVERLLHPNQPQLRDDRAISAADVQQDGQAVDRTSMTSHSRSEPDLSDEHVERVARRLYRAHELANTGRALDDIRRNSLREIVCEAIRLGAVAAADHSEDQ